MLELQIYQLCRARSCDVGGLRRTHMLIVSRQQLKRPYPFPLFFLCVLSFHLHQPSHITSLPAKLQAYESYAINMHHWKLVLHPWKINKSTIMVGFVLYFHRRKTINLD